MEKTIISKEELKIKVEACLFVDLSIIGVTIVLKGEPVLDISIDNMIASAILIGYARDDKYVDITKDIYFYKNNSIDYISLSKEYAMMADDFVLKLRNELESSDMYKDYEVYSTDKVEGLFSRESSFKDAIPLIRSNIIMPAMKYSKQCHSFISNKLDLEPVIMSALLRNNIYTVNQLIEAYMHRLVWRVRCIGNVRWETIERELIKNGYIDKPVGASANYDDGVKEMKEIKRKKEEKDRKERNEKIVAMRDAGHSYSEISKVVNCSVSVASMVYMKHCNELKEMKEFNKNKNDKSLIESLGFDTGLRKKLKNNDIDTIDDILKIYDEYIMYHHNSIHLYENDWTQIAMKLMDRNLFTGYNIRIINKLNSGRVYKFVFTMDDNSKYEGYYECEPEEKIIMESCKFKLNNGILKMSIRNIITQINNIESSADNTFVIY